MRENVIDVVIVVRGGRGRGRGRVVKIGERKRGIKKYIRQEVVDLRGIARVVTEMVMVIGQ